MAFLKLCRFEDAIKDFDSDLQFRPTQPTSLYGRGIAKLKTGDEKGGQEDLVQAKAQDKVNRNDVAKEFESYGVNRCPPS
jgi:hypothetical protein